MKHSGALKLEIIKPLNCTWDEAGQRMRAMSFTLGRALNMTQRELWPLLNDSLEAVRDGDNASATVKKNKAWANSRKLLKQHWLKAMQEYAEFRKYRENHPSVAPVLDCIASETEQQIKAKWNGEPYKEMLQGKRSVPSWRTPTPFYAEARHCSVSGGPDQAVLSFPLWGAGAKATRFAVAPCGGNARALWNNLQKDYANRAKVIELQRVAKGPSKKDLAKMTPAQQRQAAVEKQRAEFALEDTSTHKLGAVGIKYDRKKRKWYALISYTQFKRDLWKSDGQAAAVNFGVNNFLQAYAEDGYDFSYRGEDIVVTRSRFQSMRRSIQNSMRFFGSGAQGRGVKRRELAMTKRQGAEQRWTQTKIRTIAYKLIAWCERHHINELYLEDLKGMRDEFEQKTEGQAHEQIKRYIHSWPWYETAMAIERQANEVGTVKVFRKSARYVSQRCPGCGHTSPENISITTRQGLNKDLLMPAHGGRTIRYRAVENYTRFECQSCGLKADGDLVACANHLTDVGKTHCLHKRQEAARKRVANALTKAVSKAGERLAQKGMQTVSNKRTARKPRSK